MKICLILSFILAVISEIKYEKERLNIGELVNQRIVAVTDIKSAKNFDLVLASSSTLSTDIISIYKFDSSNGNFIEHEFKTPIQVKGTVINAVVNDFNNDGKVDILVTYKTDTNIQNDIFYIDDFNSDKLTFSSVKLITQPKNSFLFFGDFQFNSLINIMYFNYEAKKRQITYFDQTQKSFQVKDFSTLLMSQCSQNSTTEITNEILYSSAFADLDGDCVNDLLIVSTDGEKKFVEIWRGNVINEKFMGYCLTQKFELDPSIQRLTLSDIDRNGYIDIVYSINSKGNLAFGVNYNLVKRDIGVSDDYCEKAMGKGIDTIFSNFSNISNYNNTIYQTNLNYELFQDDVFNIQPIIRTGDYNIDSYPDLIMTLKNRDNEKNYIMIFMNQDPLNSTYRRGFDSSNVVQVNPDFNFQYSALFDLDERGKLDIFTVTKSNNKFNVIAYKNTGSYDAYFLKLFSYTSPNNYYSNCIGTTFRFANTDLSGNKRLDAAFQSPILTDLSLNLPYSFIGLGRMNNYIENLAIITPIFVGNNVKNYKIQTPIIPNSHLIVSSNPSYISNPKIAWKIEYYLNPSNKFLVLIIIVVSLLIIFLILVIFLHRKEMNQDEKEKRLNFW